MRKRILILGSLVIVIGLYALFAALWDRSDPKAAMLHDVSTSFTVKWNIDGTDYSEGTNNDIANEVPKVYNVGIWDGGTNVTDEWAIAHAFLAAATANVNTITLDSNNPGSNGERGTLKLATNSSARFFVIAYKSSTNEYLTEYVIFY